MARFYKTQSASPMDYMYQLNLPLMQQVLATNEAGVNQELQRADQIGDMATKFNYLTPDADRAKAITEDYAKQVDDLTRAIQQDPMNWRKKKGDIKNLARGLEQNYKVGEISKISSNYSRYKELDDYITKREEAGKLSPYEGSVFRQKALESIKEGTTYNPSTGQYNLLNAVKPMDTIDIRDRLSKFIDNMKANESLEWDTQAGQYFKKTSEGREYISPERIVETAMSGLMGDNELKQYLKQRTDFGLMQGVFDQEGKFINPYNYVMNPASEIEKQQIATLQNQINEAKKTNPNLAANLQSQLNAKVSGLSARKRLEGNRESSLFPVIASLAGEYSYDKVKSGIDIKNNSLYNLGVNLDFQSRQKGLDRQLKDQQFKDKQKQADQFHKDLMNLNWYKALNPPPKGGSSGTKGKTKAEEVKIPTDVGNQDATPWLNDKFYTNQGLSATINESKPQIEDLSGKVKSYQTELLNTLKGRDIDQLTPTERAKVDQLQIGLNNANSQLQDKAAQADWARQWYRQSVDFALSNKDPKKGPVLTDQERELYNQFQNDRHGEVARKEIEEYNKQSRLTEDLAPGTTPISELALGKQNRLNAYLAVKTKVDKARDFYLDKAKKVANQAPTIEFGTDDRKAINALLTNRTHGLQFFNSEGIEGGGLDLGKEAATFRDGSLQKYITDHNGEIEYLGVSPSLGFDEGKTGAVMRVRIKNKDKTKSSVGDIPSDKDFYVTLDSDTQQSIGLKYASNSNEQISNLGKQLLNGRDQLIRNKFMDIRNQIDPQTNEYGPAKTVDIPVSGGSIKTVVRSFYRGAGEYDYYVTFKKADGTEVPMKSSSSTNGFFDSIDQFIDDFNTNYQNQKMY
jgi:hypothetical protein